MQGGDRRQKATPAAPRGSLVQAGARAGSPAASPWRRQCGVQGRRRGLGAHLDAWQPHEPARTAAEIRAGISGSPPPPATNISRPSLLPSPASLPHTYRLPQLRKRTTPLVAPGALRPVISGPRTCFCVCADSPLRSRRPSRASSNHSGTGGPAPRSGPLLVAHLPCPRHTTRLPAPGLSQRRQHLT